jgi:ankyrin repeat protein
MMRRHRRLILCFALSILVSGCALIVPSQHRTEGYAPVFAAASAGDLATVQKAVDRDPVLVKATEWDNATLLHDAVQQKHEDVAVYLLDKGADVNAVTKDGLTPLHMAAQNGDIAIVTLLLSHGAKLDPVDSKGWTPLDRAEKWDHPNAAAFLKRHGAHEGTAVR